MKKIIILSLILLGTTGLHQLLAQENNTLASASPKIEFAEKEHDFGQIEENGGSVSHSFTFVNQGDAPLMLTSVRPSCGCTSPKWSRTPVKPGESGTIKATFNPSRRPGSFRKSITVATNDPKTPRIILFIKGNVVNTIKEVAKTE